MSSNTVFVAGHSGLVGSALVRALTARGELVITADHSDLDLRDQAATHEFLQATEPDKVIVAAGTVGGILANSTRPAEFLYDNMLIHANTIDASFRAGVTKLLYLGSSCIYPRMATQPITEDQLLSGPLEPTNEPYAIAKIAGIKLCDAYRAQYGCNFISAMPTNLYGPGDRFDLDGGHVLPSLMLKCHTAKVNGDDSIEVWGSGVARREFMHVDDLAHACLFLLDEFDEPGPINVGTGIEHSIGTLATMLRDLICPEVELVFDPSMPEGTPRKVLDTTRLAEMGWTSTIPLSEGIASTYDWFVTHHASQLG
jgi:GDP-L-fucose synthase